MLFTYLLPLLATSAATSPIYHKPVVRDKSQTVPALFEQWRARNNTLPNHGAQYNPNFCTNMLPVDYNTLIGELGWLRTRGTCAVQVGTYVRVACTDSLAVWLMNFDTVDGAVPCTQIVDEVYTAIQNCGYKPDSDGKIVVAGFESWNGFHHSVDYGPVGDACSPGSAVQSNNPPKRRAEIV